MNRDLNAAQREVLQWLADGGSTHPPREEFKTSARALANRGLATVTRRRGVWTATLTEAGRYYAANDAYPVEAFDAVARGASRVRKTNKDRTTTQPVNAVPPARSGKSPNSHLTRAQFAILTAIAENAEAGRTSEIANRRTLLALRDRGLIRLTGSRSGWAATITPDGQRRVDQEARRLREKAAREAAEAAEKERQAREAALAQQRAADLMDRLLSAGRVDVAHDYTESELLRIEREARRLGTLPEGEKLAHEHIRMDPDLGFTLYLRPDYEQRIPVRTLKAPGRVPKTKHPAVERFLERRANVSKGSIPRAGRFLQGVVDACDIVGWKVTDKVSRSFGGNDIHSATDLEFRIGSTTYELAISEAAAGNRRRSPSPYVQEWDYYRGHTSKTVANKAFEPSGRLTVTVTTGWGATDLFRLSDEPGAPLEDQLAVLIRKLELRVAEEKWEWQERERRQKIRQERGEEIRAAVFEKVRYERNAKQAVRQLKDRQTATWLRDYANEVDLRAGQLDGEAAVAAGEWAKWLRDHAARVDPLNGDLNIISKIQATPDELQPHMKGWSPHGYH